MRLYREVRNQISPYPPDRIAARIEMHQRRSSEQFVRQALEDAPVRVQSLVEQELSATNLSPTTHSETGRISHSS